MCSLYWNSSKIKKVICSTTAAEILSLVDGCDVARYINNLLSELLHTNISNLISTEPITSLSITVYTDKQSLYDAVHSPKQTLEKRLLIDISSIWEMVERNEITVTWISKEKQLSDVLTKSGAPSNTMLQTLNTSKMIEL